MNNDWKVIPKDENDDSDENITTIKNPTELESEIQLVYASYSDGNLEEFREHSKNVAEYCETTDDEIENVILETKYHEFLLNSFKNNEDLDFRFNLLKTIEAVLYAGRQFTEYYISTDLIQQINEFINPPISFLCTQSLRLIYLFILDFPDRFSEFSSIITLEKIYQIFLSIGSEHIHIDSQLSGFFSKYIELYSKYPISDDSVNEILEISKFILSLDLEGSNTIVTVIINLIASNSYTIANFYQDDMIAYLNSYFTTVDEKKIIHISKLYQLFLSKEDFLITNFPIQEFINLLSSTNDFKPLFEVCRVFSLLLLRSDESIVQNLLQFNIIEILLTKFANEDIKFNISNEMALLMAQIIQKLDYSHIAQIISETLIQLLDVPLEGENMSDIQVSLDAFWKIIQLYDTNDSLSKLSDIFHQIDLFGQIQNLDPQNDEQSSLITNILDKIESI